MNKVFLFALFLFSILSTSVYSKTEIDKAFMKRTKSVGTKFTLYSPDIYNGKEILENQIYNGFGCNGKNISPKLVWKNEPAGTKSFAITIFDKDAETGSGWWHWILYNIPSNVFTIPADASEDKKLLPKGAVQGLNDYGEKKFGGVCKTNGKKHNYVITLYALNVEKLDLPKNASPAMVNYFLNLHKISTVEIKAFYTQRIGNNYKITNKNSTKNNIKYNFQGKSATSTSRSNSLNKNISKTNKNVIIEE